MAFHNTHADNSIEFSPYFLLFCQHMKTPIDNAIQGELPVVSPHFRTDLQTFIENVKLSRHIAIENLVHNSSINKTRYDNKDQDYRIEQHVWLLRLLDSHSLYRYYAYSQALENYCDMPEKFQQCV